MKSESDVESQLMENPLCLPGWTGQGTVLDEIAEHIVVQDRHMRIVWANKAAGDSVKLCRDDLLGRHCYEIWHDRSEPCRGCPVRTALDTGQPDQAEIQTPDGRQWFIKGYPVRDQQGDLAGAIEITMDITERKHAEIELRESQERYWSLFQHCNDAIFLHDLEGNIIDVNQKAVDLFGYSKSDLLSLRIVDIHPPQALVKSRQALEHISKHGFVSFEIDFRKSNGDVFPAEVSSSIFEIQGRKVIQGIVRDITERKRSERALRHSEEQHRSLVENINEIIFTLDTQGRFTYISPVVERILGYQAGEITGRPFNCFVHPDDAPGLLVTFEQTLNGDLQRHEFRVLAKDGSTHFVVISCRPLTEDEHLMGLTGIMADITESRMANAVLKETEEMYETLVRTTTDAVTVTDLQATLTEVSSRTLQLHGYDSAGDLVGRSAFELIAPQDHKRALTNMKKTLKEGYLRRVEYTFLRKDGTQFIGELDCAVIKDAAGKPKGFIATTKDITERKRAEQALRRSEQRLRDIAEHASEWIWEVDAQGIYTYSSPVIGKILGYQPEEVLGKYFFDLYPPQEQDRKKEAVFDMFAKRRPFAEYIHRNIRKDGREVWLSSSGVPILGENGDLMGYRGADTDITHSKTAEEQLLAERDRLVRTLRAIEDGVIIMDPEGRVVLLNRSAEELTGWSEAQAGGKDLAEVFRLGRPEQPESYQELVPSLIRSQQDSKVGGHGTLTTKDGHRVAVGFTAAKIRNKDREISGLVLIFSSLR